MINYIKEPGDKIVLHAIIINSSGNLEPQPLGLPELMITKVDETGTESVLVASSLTQDIPGEYYYIWEAPSTLGYYKARYRVSIESEITFGYDFLEVTEPSGQIITVVGL